MSDTDLQLAAEGSGGPELRRVAEYIETGKIPRGQTVLTLCKAVQGAEKRGLLVSLAIAAEDDLLDQWAIKHSRGVKFLTELKRTNPKEFAKLIRSTVEKAGGVVQAARALGVSPRSMFRYNEEARE